MIKFICESYLTSLFLLYFPVILPSLFVAHPQSKSSELLTIFNFWFLIFVNKVLLLFPFWNLFRKVVLTKPSPCSTPEYAKVENDEYTSNSLPHGKCHKHPEGAVITVMPQDPVPYASATLFLAPNMREYMAHRNKCQENSADSRCSSRINSSRVDSGMYGDMDPELYSETGSLAGHKPGMTGMKNFQRLTNYW